MTNEKAKEKMVEILGTESVDVRVSNASASGWRIELEGNGKSIGELLEELAAMKKAWVASIRGERG